jgi:hypothetical protein
MAGQINIGTPCGDLIYNITKREDVNTIVEIGTWNGEGSTMCVIKSLMDLKIKKEFISVELYPDMYEKANLFLSKYKDYVTLLNGRIIEYEDAFWFDHNSINFMSDEHARLYYKKDLDYLKTTIDVFEKMPEKIDLLILDGGEYTTYPEWIKLKDKTKIVVLDDSKILKCSKIRQEILDSGNYQILYDNLNVRNGFSVFEKNI